MRLDQKDVQQFRRLASSYLIEDRCLSSQDILNSLTKDDPAL